MPDKELTPMMQLIAFIDEELKSFPDDVINELEKFVAYSEIRNKATDLLAKERTMVEGSIIDLLMKDHNLPFGLEYYSRLNKAEETASDYFTNKYISNE